MSVGSRYEILDTIAVGDFATVYRARDRDLGREVAVKQIHPQFLHDERQLARYWQEAQLLATLQHPNILTIYDVVRPRGWLIVELMRGNLEQFAHGQPIDLEYLRMALGGCLSALEFLHRNGVIHGDIKPSNILIDAQGRVKLGDFGLARRASNESGSLLKGTTKYMAPELVSNQFGPVGPASDLYSLGFAAYELICGASQFESLFPGLSTFGRDRQIAWMMWHAAPDRHLPEIDRVLEGVPPELARVVQKMTAKDQSQRYTSARQALNDLRVDPNAAPPLPPEEDAAAMAAQAAAARKKKWLLRGAVTGLTCVVLLVAALLLLPPKPPPKPVDTGPTHGIVANVYPDETRLEIRVKLEGEDNEVVKTVSLRGSDRVFINDKAHSLRDLKPGDLLDIKQLRDESGRKLLELRAARPVINRGHITNLLADEAKFTFTIDEGDDKGKEREVAVPKDLKIALNGGNPETGGEMVTLDELQVDDRVVVADLGMEGGGRQATSITAERVMTFEGQIGGVDASHKIIEAVVGSEASPTILKLPYRDNCEVTINNQRIVAGQVLKPSDLQPKDKATIAHDSYVVRVNAYRVLGEAGVVQRIDYDARSLDVVRQGQEAATKYEISPQCQITLGGDPVQLTDLRIGDNVDITHDSPPDAKILHAIRVAAVRPADRSRWAMLIGNQAHDDVLISKLTTTDADIKLLADALTKRYQVPEDQCIQLVDESRVRLEQSIPDRLRHIPADAKLIVYVAGHAYKDDDGKIWLAPKAFDLKPAQMAGTGLALQWLVDQLEDCPAKEKLLLLDCCQAGTGADLKLEPSTAEMLDSLKAPPGRAALRTVTAIASCKTGQRGLALADKGHDLFAWCLSEAYLGRADKNYDNRLEPTELFTYLTATMPSLAGGAGGSQEPKLFLPDARPPRLTVEARKAIRKLAGFLRQEKIVIDDLNQQYLDTAQLSDKQPEPKILYALTLLKDQDKPTFITADKKPLHAPDRDKVREEATKTFEELKSERPELWMAAQGIAWVRINKRQYRAAVDDLKELAARLPAGKPPAATFSPDAQRALQWIGQVREFFESAVDNKLLQPSAEALAALDAAVAARGDDAARLYQEGRSRTRAKTADFDRRIAGADNKADALKLETDRKQIKNYASFPYDEAAQRVLDGLNE